MGEENCRISKEVVNQTAPQHIIIWRQKFFHFVETIPNNNLVISQIIYFFVETIQKFSSI